MKTMKTMKTAKTAKTAHIFEVIGWHYCDIERGCDSRESSAYKSARAAIRGLRERVARDMSYGEETYTHYITAGGRRVRL